MSSTMQWQCSGVRHGIAVAYQSPSWVVDCLPSVTIGEPIPACSHLDDGPAPWVLYQWFTAKGSPMTIQRAVGQRPLSTADFAIYIGGLAVGLSLTHLTIGVFNHAA
jgi:hypothetical protein